MRLSKQILEEIKKDIKLVTLFLLLRAQKISILSLLLNTQRLMINSWSIFLRMEKPLL